MPITEAVNVFTGMPAHGTVVGVLLSEQMSQMRRYGAKLAAISAGSGNHNYVDEYENLYHDNLDLWTGICIDLKIPYAWPVSVDYITGDVYIDNPGK